MAAELKNDDAHLWQVRLDDDKWDNYAAVLNDSEREKAARYRTTTLQQRYRRCRSAVRVILADYLDQAPAALNFQTGQYGKPELPDCHVSFNVSHTGDIALVALARHALGVDLEGTDKERNDLTGLIDMVCHPSEKIRIAPLPDAEKLAQFYQLWTHKEAYCKMLGLGLHQAMTTVYFQPADGHHRWRVCADDHTPPTTTFVYQLDAPEGFSASLCLPLAAAKISYFSA